MSRKPITAAADDPQWYKDAVIYQLHVKSFFDANNDGVGDFPGSSPSSTTSPSWA